MGRQKKKIHSRDQIEKKLIRSKKENRTECETFHLCCVWYNALQLKKEGLPAAGFGDQILIPSQVGRVSRLTTALMILAMIVERSLTSPPIRTRATGTPYLEKTSLKKLKAAVITSC